MVAPEEEVRAVLPADEFVIHRRAVELPEYWIRPPSPLLLDGDLGECVGADRVRQAVVNYPRVELLALVVPEVEPEVRGAPAGGLDHGVNVGA